MATLVQTAPPQDQQVFQQQHHHHNQNRNQQHHPSAQYTAAIPVRIDHSGGHGTQQSNIFKQVNIIPGLDAENAVVDTGVKVVRNLANQAPVSINTVTANEFDGKRMRRSIQRRTVDYNASSIQMIKHRLFRRSILQKPIIQPDPLYYTDLLQPQCILYNPINSVTTRFVRASTNKVRCPVFTVAWTPEGRRVVTGTSSGEFTLWNGLTFNFETILQAHESAVRAMEWSNNDMWLLSGDHNGVIKYWQSNMNNVKMLQAHNDPIRGLSFCPTDNKFVTCSDDGLIKVWDFYRCQEERVLRGHGADVKCLGWHPSKGMIASGSKDSQKPLKLWDPKSGASLATIHGHKSTVMDLNWNKNGNWLLTGSRDRLLKVFDIRTMKELYTFRGHKKEAASVHWHPLYEEMFASGGSDGSIMFWLMGCAKELGVMNQAHDGMIWDLKWHPLGHILCSASNDHTTKFWTRNRPGDKMRDKYNLNVLPAGFEDDYEYELPSNNSQSENDSQMDSTLDSSYMSTESSGGANEKITSKELNTPIIKALLEQTTLEVSKPTSKEPPAQIYTVTSTLRPNAPVFKIDRTIQEQALHDAEMLEKLREKQLRGRLNVDENAIMAPSLLDLDIIRPDFLKDLEWDNDSSDPPPFIEDLKRKAAEKTTAQQKSLETVPPQVLVQNPSLPPTGHTLPNGPSYHDSPRGFEEPAHKRLYQEQVPHSQPLSRPNFDQNHAPSSHGLPSHGASSNGPPNHIQSNQGPPHQGPPTLGRPELGPPNYSQPSHGHPNHVLSNSGPSSQGPPNQPTSSYGPRNQAQPHQGQSHQGQPHQGQPHQGKNLQGQPHQGQPHQGLPNQGPQNHGLPNDGPPNHRPNHTLPNQGPPNHGPPDHVRPNHGPPSHVHGPPNHASTNHGPLNHGPPNHRPPNHGPPNHGPPNHGPPDHGLPDHGRPDHGRPDHGRPDHGPPDRGRPDHGPLDRGRPDHGPPDRGPPDHRPNRDRNMMHPQQQNRPNFKDQNRGPDFMDHETHIDRPYQDRPPDHFKRPPNLTGPSRMDGPDQMFERPPGERNRPSRHEPSGERMPPPQHFNGHQRFDAPPMNNNQFKNNMDHNNRPRFHKNYDERKPPPSQYPPTSRQQSNRRWEEERLGERWRDERIG